MNVQPCGNHALHAAARAACTGTGVANCYATAGTEEGDNLFNFTEIQHGFDAVNGLFLTDFQQ